MEKFISCCGMVCGDCAYYPNDCKGCGEIQGKAFWLEFTGGSVCEIYACCVQQKGLAHCGLCPELPCGRYDGADPTKSQAENDADLEGQLRMLRELAKQ